jgi:lipid II:glycine glycyltransferase (peptidoglycan interpeptide bridge formation enzyme)
MSSAWQRLDKNTRRLIRRSQDTGMVFSAEGDFEAFYGLHLATVERKGAPLYLAEDAYRRFVADLCRRGLARLYDARLPDGKVIASQLVLTGPHPVTHTVCAGSSKEALSLGVASFLRWKAFEDLAAAGYLGNDLTDAELNPVTRFKAQFGGDLKLFFEASRCNAASRQLYDTAYGLAAWTKRHLRRRARMRHHENG